VTVYENTFIGTVNGAITPGNSGSGGNALTAVSAGATYDNQNVVRGDTSAALTSTADCVLRWAVDTQAALAFRAYMVIPEAVTSDFGIFRFSHLVDTTAFALYLNGANTLRASAKGASNIWTAGATFPVGEVIRVEGYTTQGDTTSSGSARFAYYQGDSLTPIDDSGVLTGLNLGGDLGGFTQARVGKLATTNPYPTMWVDELKVHTGADATGFIGPVPPPPTMYRWNGSEYVPVDAYRWNGTEYVQLDAYRWDGATYVPLVTA